MEPEKDEFSSSNSDSGKESADVLSGVGGNFYKLSVSFLSFDEVVSSHLNLLSLADSEFAMCSRFG